LVSSSYVIRLIRSRRLRWVGRVARTGDEKCTQNLVGKPEGERLLRRLSVDGE